MWWTMKNQQPNSQHIKFNCFFWERMYIWKLAVMISLFRGYGQIFVGTLLAQLTKYNKERGGRSRRSCCKEYLIQGSNHRKDRWDRGLTQIFRYVNSKTGCQNPILIRMGGVKSRPTILHRSSQSPTSVVLTDRKRTAQILRAKTLRVLRQS